MKQTVTKQNYSYNKSNKKVLKNRKPFNQHRKKQDFKDSMNQKRSKTNEKKQCVET